MIDLEGALALEREVWDGLMSGDASVDERLLHRDFLGVYGSGFAGKSAHVGQLEHGPTVANYALSEAHLVMLAENLALLAYRAEWQRLRAGKVLPAEAMYVSSIWRFEDGMWRNIFSQDTLAES